MVIPLPLAYPAACPDCPGARLDTLEALVGATKETCAFDTVRLDSRSFAPRRWGEHYAFGLVRRGVFIRQRVGPDGAAVAVDAAGPGCLFPISSGEEPPLSTSCDYAATDVVVCLCRRPAASEALTTQTSGAEILELERSALARVERLVQARGAPTVKKKVSLLLLALADTLAPPRRRECLPSALQQRDMAKLVGIRHETFCRALTALEQAGVVARETDGLRIIERDALL